MPKTKNKPAKPYPDFPLFPHATGRWAKKIRGKMCYFGPWDDPDKALKTYLDQRDDLHAGRRPRSKSGGVTIGKLVKPVFSAKRRLVENQGKSARYWGQPRMNRQPIVYTLDRNHVVCGT